MFYIAIMYARYIMAADKPTNRVSDLIGDNIIILGITQTYVKPPCKYFNNA